MTDEQKAILLLNGLGQYDSRLWTKMVSSGAPPEALWVDGEPLWERLGISERCRGMLREMIDRNWAEREFERCAESSVAIVSCVDKTYPLRLNDLRDPPLMLYVKGNKFSVPKKSVAVVGTRRCSGYGRRVSYDFGACSAANKWCVVSGGAKGIDGAAHEGALKAGGVTIAVFGNGINVCFPSEHRELFERIEQNGALVSEYHFGAKGEAWRFPRRNRIIAGLSARVLVVEAPQRSGAMITARMAGDIGRDVWSAPGRIGEESSYGSNRLIFDGAAPLIDMESFFGLEEAGFIQSPLFKEFKDPDAAVSPNGKEPSKKVPLSDEERSLLRILAAKDDLTVDNLAGEAKMVASEVFKIVTFLSLRGLIYQSGPGRYRISDD